MRLPAGTRALARLLRAFFNLLYTHLAWSYDLVAWTTSVGQWRTWQRVALEDLPPGRVLELGHGPGHLLLELSRGRSGVVGVDPSHQMNRLAWRRIRERRVPADVVRASALALPFPERTFDAIVSTFPTEFIFEARCLAESRRTLRPGGLLVVLPSVEITGANVLDRWATWLYRVTRQSGAIDPAWLEPLRQASFSVEANPVLLPRARVWRIRARRVPA